MEHNMSGIIVDKRRKGVKRGVDVTCLQCGVKMILEPSQISRGRGKFCSLSCCAIYRNTVLYPQNGSNNQYWKGGVSSDNMRYRIRQIERWPKKEKARKLCHSAVRSGALIKKPCEVCGTEEDIHGHHDDYSKPLSVRWLCRKHHREVHKGKH